MPADIHHLPAPEYLGDRLSGIDTAETGPESPEAPLRQTPWLVYQLQMPHESIYQGA